MEIARALCQFISCELINKFYRFVVNVDKFWHLIKQSQKCGHFQFRQMLPLALEGSRGSDKCAPLLNIYRQHDNKERVIGDVFSRDN